MQWSVTYFASIFYFSSISLQPDSCSSNFRNIMSQKMAAGGIMQHQNGDSGKKSWWRLRQKVFHNVFKWVSFVFLVFSTELHFTSKICENNLFAIQSVSTKYYLQTIQKVYVRWSVTACNANAKGWALQWHRPNLIFLLNATLQSVILCQTSALFNSNTKC